MLKCEIIASFRAPDGKIMHKSDGIYVCSEADAARLEKAKCVKILPGAAEAGSEISEPPPIVPLEEKGNPVVSKGYTRGRRRKRAIS